MSLRVLILTLAILAVGTDLLAAGKGGAGGTVTVRGHVRKDGTYVPPHHRTAPDSNFQNNWSTLGNHNPYTGESGTAVTPPPRSSKLGAGAYRVPLLSAPAQGLLLNPTVPSFEPNTAAPPRPGALAPNDLLAPSFVAPHHSGQAPGAVAPTPSQVAPIGSVPSARQPSYLELQKARDVDRAEYWRARGYSFDPAYMSAYSMDQKVKDVERSRYWKTQGHSFNPSYMSAYSMDQKVKDIERAKYWQSMGYAFNPDFMSAYSMDQKVRDIERSRYWREHGLHFDPNFMSAYSMDREAERRGYRPR